MVYKIEGDGSYQHTLIWRDGVEIPYEQCEFGIDESGCIAIVDGVSGSIDHMLITGVYMIISEGEFQNSRLFYLDEMLHGVQWLKGCIRRGAHPELVIKTVLLPNLVPVKEEEKDV